MDSQTRLCVTNDLCFRSWRLTISKTFTMPQLSSLVSQSQNATREWNCRSSTTSNKFFPPLPWFGMSLLLLLFPSAFLLLFALSFIEFLDGARSCKISYELPVLFGGRGALGNGALSVNLLSTFLSRFLVLFVRSNRVGRA